MIRHSVFLQSAIALAIVAPVQAAEVQVLGLQVAVNGDAETAESNGEQCGSYRLESVDFTVGSGQSEAGSISVLDAAKKEIASKELSPGAPGRITATIRGGSEKELKKDLLVVLLKVNKADDEFEVIERVESDDEGVAAFSKDVPPGNYQLGIECGSAYMAFAAPAGGGLAAGATALAIGLSDSGSSGSQAVTREPLPLPPDNNDLGPVSQ